MEGESLFNDASSIVLFEVQSPSLYSNMACCSTCYFVIPP